MQIEKKVPVSPSSAGELQEPVQPRRRLGKQAPTSGCESCRRLLGAADRRSHYQPQHLAKVLRALPPGHTTPWPAVSPPGHVQVMTTATPAPSKWQGLCLLCLGELVLPGRTLAMAGGLPFVFQKLGGAVLQHAQARAFPAPGQRLVLPGLTGRWCPGCTCLLLEVSTWEDQQQPTLVV